MKVINWLPLRILYPSYRILAMVTYSLLIHLSIYQCFLKRSKIPINKSLSDPVTNWLKFISDHLKTHDPYATRRCASSHMHCVILLINVRTMKRARRQYVSARFLFMLFLTILKPKRCVLKQLRNTPGIY